MSPHPSRLRRATFPGGEGFLPAGEGFLPAGVEKIPPVLHMGCGKPGVCLPHILKLQIVDIHGVPVLDAHLLQAGEEAALAEHLVAPARRR